MMKTMFAVSLLLLTALPAAAKKHDDGDYWKATFVGFHLVSTGTDCSGSGKINGNTTDTAHSTADTQQNIGCSDRQVREYTVEAPSGTFTLRLATGFFRHDSLQYVIPHTKVQMRTDGSNVYIRDGKDESKYVVVGAQ